LCNSVRQCRRWIDSIDLFHASDLQRCFNVKQKYQFRTAVFEPIIGCLAFGLSLSTICRELFRGVVAGVVGGRRREPGSGARRERDAQHLAGIDAIRDCGAAYNVM
jgi:hypothetical protein